MLLAGSMGMSVTRDKADAPRRPPAERASIAAAAIAIALALIALIGWITGVEALRSLEPDQPAVKPLTVLAVFAVAGSVLALSFLPASSRLLVSRLLAGFAILIGLAVLFEWSFGSLGIDQLLFSDPHPPNPGRPSPYTALTIVLVAAAMLATEVDPPRHRPFSLLVLGAAAVLVATLIGYTNEVDYLRSSSDNAGLSLQAISALAALVVAVAFVHPERGIVGFLRGDDLGARTARILLPIAIFVPLVLALLRLEGQELNLFDVEEGIALTTLGSVLVLLAVIGFTTVRLRRESLERDEAAAMLLEAARHFEISHDLICTITVEGRIHRVNPAWTAALEWTAEELQSRPIVGLVHEEDRLALSEQMVAILARGSGSGVQRLNVKSGGWRWIEWNAVSDPGSPFVFVAGRDITDRRRLEEGVAERQRRLLALTNSVPVGIYELDPDGDCIFVNEHFCELTGVEPEAVLGRGWVNVIHPDDREGVVRAWEEASAAGERLEREYRYLKPDGSIGWLVGRAVAVYDGDGEPSGYLGTVVDITERRLAERALERERSDLAEAQRIARVGSWRWDLRSGEIEWTEQNFVNHGLDPAAGVPSNEQFLAMVNPDDRDSLAAALQAAAANEEEFQTEYRVRKPDGEITFLELRGAPFAEGAVLAGTSRDVTAERDAERVKDEFFNLISHELRTPLTSIIGYAELLARGRGGAPQRRGSRLPRGDRAQLAPPAAASSAIC